RWRSRASAGHGGFQDCPSGPGSSYSGDAAQWSGLAALNRADAERRTGWYPGDREAWRRKCRSAGGVDHCAAKFRCQRAPSGLAQGADGRGARTGVDLLSAILPGATIGILGGGQLGRMTAMGARSLGYRVQVLDPDPSCLARFVVDSCFSASWDDAHSAADLARGSDVVTLEIEQIPISTMEAAAHHAPVRPSAQVLEVVQDRIRQKQWLAKNGFPLGEFRAVCSAEEMAATITAFGNDCFIKSARGGYDGRGQLRIQPSDVQKVSGEAAWKLLGERPCAVEKALALEAEVSILIAR